MTKETRVGFMCMTDFDDELENAAGGNKVYPSLEDLKRNCTCWDTCGVVKVTVVREDVVVPQNLLPSARLIRSDEIQVVSLDRNEAPKKSGLVRDGAFNWLNKLTRRERMQVFDKQGPMPPPGRPFTDEEKEAMLKLGAPRDFDEGSNL